MVRLLFSLNSWIFSAYFYFIHAKQMTSRPCKTWVVWDGWERILIFIVWVLFMSSRVSWETCLSRNSTHALTLAFSWVCSSNIQRYSTAICESVHPFSLTQILTWYEFCCSDHGWCSTTHITFATLPSNHSGNWHLALKMTLGWSVVPSAQMVTRTVIVSLTLPPCSYWILLPLPEMTWSI